MNDRFKWKKAALAVCAGVAVACGGAMNSPVSPSAVVGSVNALNADGSNLKVDAPLAVSPLFEITNVSLTPTLAARGSRGVYQTGTSLSHRFQVADSESFSNVVATGMGSTDASGVTRYTVSPELTASRRYVWRVRAELNDAFGPWSNVMAFTTAGPTAPVVPTPTPTSGGPRTPDPAPGTRLPLPNMFNTLLQFSDTSQSCPRGIKYVNNPWQDRVIDAFRLVDTRWGYNGKPNRGPSDNGGFPVIAAGDEAAYHWGAGPDQGSPDVHLVDMLVGHCGSGATVGWRVFTGEEPGFWTGAGRF